jgi:hypothetical protein
MDLTLKINSLSLQQKQQTTNEDDISMGSN